MTDASGNAILWLFPGSFSVTATPPSSNTTVATTSSSVDVNTDTSTNITLKQVVVLQGHIYDEWGTPVASQSVYAYDGSSTISARTDSTGSYTLRGAAGTYRLTITDYDHKYDFGQQVPGTYTFDINNYAPTQDTQFDITLPARQVGVHVQDATNSPVAGVKITASGNVSNFAVGSYTTSNTQVSYSENGPTTDTSGNATLWLFPGTYQLTATPPVSSNYASTSMPGVVIANDAQQTIILPQPVRLSGHVYDESGNSIPNQTIVISSPFATVGSAITDATGSYSVQVSSGTYKLDVTNFSHQNDFSLNVPGYYDFTFTNYLLVSDTQLNLTLPVRKVSLHIQDNFGNPLANIKLTTSGGGDISGLSIGGMTTTTGTNGYFSDGPTTDALGNTTMWLFPATYNIVATPPNGSIYATIAISNVAVTNDQSELVSLQYSHNPPVTTIDLSPAQNPDGTYPNPVTISMNAGATVGYTVANTYYTVDNGTIQTYAVPFMVSDVGSHTIKYWSIDNSGVEESYNSKTFTIASRPNAPTSLTASSPTQYPVLTWSNVTGATSYNVYRNGTNIVSVTNATFTDYLAQEGTDSYYVTAMGVGGESLPSNTISVLVDRTAPSISYTASPSANVSNWNNGTPVTVTFTCTDETGGSGITSCSSPVTLSNEGANQTVTGVATDAAGNISSVTPIVNIDTTAPTIGTPTLSPNVILVGSATTLTVPASDTLSGVVGGEYFVGTDPGVGNGTTMATYSNGSLSTSLGANLLPGVYVVGVRSKDAAGNWSTTSTVMLTVYDSSTTLGISGADRKGQLVPSTSRGDVMPGLTSISTDGADYGFTVQYKSGVLDSHNDFKFTYATGGHSFSLNATSFDWVTIGGTNNSQGWFQGTATVTVDGVTTTNPFYVAAVDGDRTNPTTNDFLTLKVYAPGADPTTALPIYQASGSIVLNSGNGVKIH